MMNILIPTSTGGPPNNVKNYNNKKLTLETKLFVEIKKYNKFD